MSRYLSQYLGDYFDGLDRKNLSIGVYSGHVHLQNVDFKQEAVDMLHLPVKLIHGKLGSLHVYVSSCLATFGISWTSAGVTSVQGSVQKLAVKFPQNLYISLLTIIIFSHPAKGSLSEFRYPGID